MREKLQRFSGSMMVPIILLVMVGFYVSIAMSFTEYLFPGDNLVNTLFSMFTNIGFMIMRNLPFWFAVGIAFGLAKKERGWAAFAGLVMYMSFNTVIQTYAGAQGWNADTTSVAHLVESLGYTQQAALNFNALWTTINGYFTFDMGIFSGILTGIVTSMIHNRWYNKQLPTALAFFGGTRFVVVLTTIFAIPLGIAVYYIWPTIASGLQALTNLITSSGLFGTFLFGATDKALLPFGIHHLLAFPIEYTRVGGTMEIGGTVFEGVRNIMAGQAGDVESTGYIVRNFTTGRILFQLGGLPGAAAAIYATARPENRKKIAAIVIPAAITVAFVGISEPIEYTFLFVAPALYYLVHVPLSGLAYVIAEAMNVSINGHALFFMIPNLFQPQKVHALSLLLTVPLYFAAYFFAFRWFILKFNVQTPGRAEDGRNDFYSKKEYRENKDRKKQSIAVDIIKALGGAENIDAVTNCATRLRVSVHDEDKVAKDHAFTTELGASGVVRTGKAIQIIFGPKVINIAADVKASLGM